MAGPWDRYAAQPAPSGPWDRYADQPIAPPEAAAQPEKSLGEMLENDAGVKMAKAAWPYVEDTAKTVLPSLAKGAAGVIGMPGLMRDMVNSGTDWIVDKAISGAEGTGLIGKETAELIRSRAQQAEGDKFDYLPRPKDVLKPIENVAGPLHDPKTLLGKFVGTATEFVPSALLMPGKVGMNLFNNALLAGGTSEAAGQATKGTALEP